MVNLERPAGLHWPHSVCLRITRACNAKCAFCQAPDLHDNQSWTASEIGRVAKRLAGVGVKSVKLSGGEPTTRKDLPEIICAAASEGLSVTVISNGIHITDSALNALRDCGGKLKVSVHFGDIRNDSVLGNRSFASVVNTVRRAVALGIPVGFNSVVYRENVDAMGTVLSLAEGLGAAKVSYFPVVNRGSAFASDFEDERSKAFRQRVQTEAKSLRALFPRLRIRAIDLANDDYWIIDHTGTLFISRGPESEDRILFEGKEWAIAYE